MTRRLAGISAFASLALLAAAPALAWFGRGRPGIALACVVALGVAAALTLGSRRVRLSEEVQAVVLLPFAAAWGLGEGFGFFAHVRGWDAFCHGLAGAALGVVAAGLSAGRRPGTLLARALALALAVGLFWELGEWAADRLLGTRTLGTAADTRTDLFFDALGGVLGALAVVAARRYLPAREHARLFAGLERLRPRPQHG